MSSPQRRAILISQSEGQKPDDFVHISSFAIIKGEGGILLLKRTKPDWAAGKWAIPGAIINYGEHPEAAVKRVVKEMIGSEARDVRLKDIQSYYDKHWDICLVYDVGIPKVGTLSQDTQAAEYFDAKRPPPDLRGDHLEVIQTLGPKL